MKSGQHRGRPLNSVELQEVCILTSEDLLPCALWHAAQEAGRGLERGVGSVGIFFSIAARAASEPSRSDLQAPRNTIRAATVVHQHGPFRSGRTRSMRRYHSSSVFGPAFSAPPRPPQFGLMIPHQVLRLSGSCGTFCDHLCVDIRQQRCSTEGQSEEQANSNSESAFVIYVLGNGVCRSVRPSAHKKKPRSSGKCRTGLP